MCCTSCLLLGITDAVVFEWRAPGFEKVWLVMREEQTVNLQLLWTGRECMRPGEEKRNCFVFKSEGVSIPGR